MGTASWDFGGEVAVVSGAAAGLGLQMALRLAAAGARVHALDVQVQDVHAHGDPPVDLVTHAVDLRDSDAVERVVAAIIESEGRIDHLVNNAGITRDRALWNLSDADWQDVIDVNLTGAFRLLRAVAPHMRAARRGQVVQIASVNGLRGKFGQTNYGASKAGIVALTRAAARELGPRGIRVNAVAPGMILTDMSRVLPEEILDKAVAETAVGHLGEPGDIADAVIYLLSDAAKHVTGEVLRVDGGQLC